MPPSGITASLRIPHVIIYSCGYEPPTGLAILIGAGIARILASPSHGNLAIALLARTPETLSTVANSLRSTTPNPIETFPTDTSPGKLSKAFEDIREHESFKGLKLKVGVFHIKHASKKPFLEETHGELTKALEEYVGGAMLFSQEVIKRLFADHGDNALADGGEKKGTLIFTGTLGAMKTNAAFGSYGASRSGVRSLAQALAKEYSGKGIHVAHTVVNGAVRDEEGRDQRRGKRIAAEELGRNYWWLCEQGPSCWTHELDFRPPQEKF